MYNNFQVIQDQIPEFEEKDLRLILDPMEARLVKLDLKCYFDVVNCISENRDGPRRITAILTDRVHQKPVGLATVIRNDNVRSDGITQLPGSMNCNDLVVNSRRAFYEIQYVVRHKDVRGKRVGDILVASVLGALEAIAFDKPMTKIVWLLVAGSFTNVDAIRLYLRNNFQVAGLVSESGDTDDCLMMALFDLGKFAKTIESQLHRSLEERFLLPRLKSRYLQDLEVQVDSETTVVATMPSADDQVDQSDSNSEISIISTPRSVPSDADRLVSVTEHQTHRQQYVATEEQIDELGRLAFRPFVQQLKWSSSLVISISGTEDMMMANISEMSKREQNNRYFKFFQHLEMGRQIELYAEKVEKFPFDVISDIKEITGLTYSDKYLQDIIRVCWAIFRYPILEQLTQIQTCREAMKRIPQLERVMDFLTESGRRPPDNILLAQRDRHDVYLRIYLSFPEAEIPDGDGLPYCRLIKCQGLYINDNIVHDDDILLSPHFRCVTSAIGTDVRSRLVGFDTHEKPTGVDAAVGGIPQPFFLEGKRFLEVLLQQLLLPHRICDGVLICDCYGMDCFQRLLVDIRAVKYRPSLDEDDSPTLRRFEVANRFLTAGIAHPTYCSYTDDSLLNAFANARDTRTGCFAGNGEFVHPAKCRRFRRNATKGLRRRPRPRYTE